MKNLKKLLLCAFIGVSSVVAIAEDVPVEIFQNTKRQDRLEKKAAQAAATASMVDSLLKAKSFTFVAERMVTQMANNPYSTLSNYYSFVVNPKSVDSNLPYSGKMYKAPVNVSEGPLTFTSDDFKYEQRGVAKGKEKAYINMQVSVRGTNYQITIEVFDTATAVFNVLLDTGTSASYYGRIEPTKAH